MKKNWSIETEKAYFIPLSTVQHDQECKKEYPVFQKEEICEDVIDLLDAYEHLSVEWIGFEEFIKGLNKEFSRSVFFGGESVIIQVLKTGLKEYAKTIRDSEHQYYPHERLNVFLTACFSKAIKVCNFKVTDLSTEESWTLAHEKTFIAWGSNRCNLSIQSAGTDTASFNQYLYSKVVPMNFKHAMRRFKHETAILGGSNHYCD